MTHVRGFGTTGRDKTPGKLYLEIATLLRRAVETGRWLPGEQLPTLDAIGEEFGVSLVTVRQAVALLRGEGMLVSRHGVGTFVPADFKDKAWIDLQWDTDAPASRKDFSDRSVQIVQERRKATIPGHIDPDYVYLQRIHRTKGIPYAVAHLYVNRSVFSVASARFRREMMIPLIYEIVPHLIKGGRQTLTIGTADVELARLLNISLNAPIGEINRVIDGENGSVLFFAHSLYRGDIVRLETALQPAPPRN
jgi:GntR family transcriptional regulator